MFAEMELQCPLELGRQNAELRSGCGTVAAHNQSVPAHARLALARRPLDGKRHVLNSQFACSIGDQCDRNRDWRATSHISGVTAPRHTRGQFARLSSHCQMRSPVGGTSQRLRGRPPERGSLSSDNPNRNRPFVVVPRCYEVNWVPPGVRDAIVPQSQPY